MQKWEYLFLTGGWHDDKRKRFVVHSDDGTEFASWPGGSMTSWQHLANQLGDQGWELISTDGARYFFKRPKP